MKTIKEIPHVSVCFPKGFKAGGINCGIKMGKKDLAMVYSEKSARLAGTFTSNAFAAAPVLWCREIVRKGKARAVIVNSGNANACTGEEGFRDAQRMAQIAAQSLNLSREEVLVSSTGIIGRRLPMKVIEPGIQKLARSISSKGDALASHAILTTDTFPKTVALEMILGGKKVRMGAMTKGAGMIQPSMATMLCYITTDCLIERKALQQALSRAVDQSFNCITVDGDMSTNDSVILFANGMAGNKEVKTASEDYKIFCNALNYLTIKLAKMIAMDGEGATKLVEVRVNGALTEGEARKGAYAVANSNLFKVSLYAQEPNWGRLMAALGSVGLKGLNPNKVIVKINGKILVKSGIASGIKKGPAKKLMRPKQILIEIQLGMGKGKAGVWTCDLSHKYVDINM